MKYVNISAQTMENYFEEIRQLNDDIRARFEKLERRIRKNEVIAGFYEGIYNDILSDDNYYQSPLHMVDSNGELITVTPEINVRLAKYKKHCRVSQDSVKECSRHFVVDYYRLQGVKDIKKKTSCNNKFCDACQSAISQQRYEKFAPVLEILQENFDIAHIVFTIPNCHKSELQCAIDKMYEARQAVIRYLTGSKKIRGIDFERFGYRGGISSLEVTRNEETGKFHPHFHCAFVFAQKSGVFGRKTHINKYSYDYGEKVRYFNDFEILLQKVWRLKIDGLEVNRHSIENLPLGYDVIVEYRKNFKEIFKYTTKGALKYDKDVSRVLGLYSDFMYLDWALYQRRVMQTYGCMRGIPVTEEVEQKAGEEDTKYQELIARLKSIEEPEEQIEFLENLQSEENRQNIKYISCHNMKAVINAEDAEEWELPTTRKGK